MLDRKKLSLRETKSGPENSKSKLDSTISSKAITSLAESAQGNAGMLARKMQKMKCPIYWGEGEVFACKKAECCKEMQRLLIMEEVLTFGSKVLLEKKRKDIPRKVLWTLMALSRVCGCCT